MSILQKIHKRVVDRFVDHAVHEHVGAFFDCGAGSFQFGCVHCHANFVRVTLFNGRANNWAKGIDRMVFVDNVPNLHQIGFLFGKFAHELARLIGSVDLHDRRIA